MKKDKKTHEVHALRLQKYRDGGIRVGFVNEVPSKHLDETELITLPVMDGSAPGSTFLEPAAVDRLRRFIAEPPATNARPIDGIYLCRQRDGGLIIEFEHGDHIERGSEDAIRLPMTLIGMDPGPTAQLSAWLDGGFSRLEIDELQAVIQRQLTVAQNNFVEHGIKVDRLEYQIAQMRIGAAENAKLRLEIADLHDRLRRRPAVDFDMLRGTLEAALEIVTERVDLELDGVGFDPTQYPEACARVAEVATTAKYLRDGIVAVAAEVKKEEDEAAAEAAAAAAIRFDRAEAVSDARRTRQGGMMDITEIHNRDVGTLVAGVVKPTLEAGGEVEDVLVLLEGVVAGVILAIGKPGGDRAIVDALSAGVIERLAVMRPTYERARTGLVAGAPSSGKSWRPHFSGRPS